MSGGNGHAKPKRARKRPRPEKTAAETWEIVRLRRVKHLRRLLRDRYGPILPDDDAGREDLFWLLLHISAGADGLGRINRAIDVLTPWMAMSERQQIITKVQCEPHLPTAKRLGKELNVTNDLRERLRLWAFTACDMSPKQMREWRKLKQRAQDRKRRKPRAEYLAAHDTSRTKPWLALGTSRASWYRRQRAARQAEPQTNAQEDQPDPTTRRQSPHVTP